MPLLAPHHVGFWSRDGPVPVLEPEFQPYRGPLWGLGLAAHPGSQDSSREPEALDFQPCVYIGNHQDNLDVLIFGSLFPGNTIVIGKKEIAWIPFFNLFYAAAGNILLDRKHRTRALSGMAEAGRIIRERGRSVMIFPEGTRNRSGKGLLPFKKGAFHLAVSAQLPILPMVAGPLEPLVSYRLKRVNPGVITVRVLEPIPTGGKTMDDLPALLQLARDRMLAEYEKLEREFT